MLLDIKDLSNAVIIDCETTGTETYDQVIDISVISTSGSATPLFSGLFKPTVDIHPDATAIHRYTADMLEKRPPFAKKSHKLMEVLRGKTVIGWRVDFDKRLIEQTAAQQFCESVTQHTGQWLDVKPLLAERFGMNEDAFSLSEACEIEGVNTEFITPHNAYSDCVMVYRLLKKIHIL